MRMIVDFSEHAREVAARLHSSIDWQLILTNTMTFLMSLVVCAAIMFLIMLLMYWYDSRPSQKRKRADELQQRRIRQERYRRESAPLPTVVRITAPTPKPAEAAIVLAPHVELLPSEAAVPLFQPLPGASEILTEQRTEERGGVIRCYRPAYAPTPWTLTVMCDTEGVEHFALEVHPLLAQWTWRVQTCAGRPVDLERLWSQPGNTSLVHDPHYRNRLRYFHRLQGNAPWFLIRIGAPKLCWLFEHPTLRYDTSGDPFADIIGLYPEGETPTHASGAAHP